MQSVYGMPLTGEQLKCVGELVVVQAQIEYVMVHVAKFAIATSKTGAYETPKALQKLPDLSLGAMIKEWLKVIESSDLTGEVKVAARHFASHMAGLTDDRNDFIHAVWMAKEGSGYTLAVPNGSDDVVAFRERFFKARPVAELQSVRDSFALSTAMLEDLRVAVMAEWKASAKSLDELIAIQNDRLSQSASETEG